MLLEVEGYLREGARFLCRRLADRGPREYFLQWYEVDAGVETRYLGDSSLLRMIILDIAG